MRNSIFIFLVMAVSVMTLQAETNGVALVTITPTGAVAVKGGAVVPAFSKTGGWRELPGKSSERYDTRHLMYFVPGSAPAIELYVCSDRQDETPDGVFEMGLVKGYIGGFAGKGGYKHDAIAFDERKVGTEELKHTVVKLEKGEQTLWVHGYIFVRKPSMTFIAIRPKEGGEEELEKYLAGVKVE